MANLTFKGFRWVGNRFAPNQTAPSVDTFPVADDYATVLKVGDPVKRVSTGYIERAATNETVLGIFAGAEQYYDGTRIRRGGTLPASTSYDTNFERVSLARVILAEGGIFEGTADDATTATTYAAYLAFIGENCDIVYNAATGDYSGVQVDISTHATTAEDVRIWDIPDRNMQDFASAGVRIRFVFNLIYRPGADSTTGV